MAQLVSVRALNRARNVRVKDSDDVWVTLSPTVDTVVDLDDAATRKSLSSHHSIGQWVVTGVEALVT